MPTTARCSQESRQRRASPAATAPTGLGNAAKELPGPVQQQPLAGPRFLFAGERLEEPRLGLRSDPGDVAQPAFRGGRAELLGRADAERPRQLHGAPRAEPQVATEAHEIGCQLPFELGELGDLPGFDQLLEPGLDPGSNSAQLPDSP